MEVADPAAALTIMAGGGLMVRRRLGRFRTWKASSPDSGSMATSCFGARKERQRSSPVSAPTDGTAVRGGTAGTATGLDLADGRWIAGWSAIPTRDVSAVQLCPTAGSRPPVTIGAGIFVNWSSSGDSVSVSGRPVDEGRSYLIPLQPGNVLPPMPAEGFHSDAGVAQLRGARRVDALTVPGPSIGVYAFYRIGRCCATSTASRSPSGPILPRRRPWSGARAVRRAGSAASGAAARRRPTAAGRRR